MADLAWPSILPPAPLWSGYAVDPQPGLMRSSIAGSLPRQRARYSTVLTRVAVRWKMSVIQLEFFKSWVQSRAAFGGAFFVIALKLGGAASETVSARFGGAPRYTPLVADRDWLVDATIEVRA